MSGGLVLLAAPTATAGGPEGTPPGNPTKTAICHRTAADSNPYVFIEVDDESLPAHYNNLPGHPPKYWKSEGTWRGQHHNVGDPRNDYKATSAADCQDQQESTFDNCPNLAGLQAADFPCSFGPTQRSVPRSEESRTLNGVGGVRTWDDVYTRTWYFDANEQEWAPNPETGPVQQNSVFTPYTQEQKVAKGCVTIAGVEEISPKVTFTEPDCDNLDGADWSGNLTDVVDYAVAGTPGLGEAVTVTATVKPSMTSQFAFPAGFDNTFEHTYVTEAELACPTVKGSESSRPKPEKTKTPAPAAAPTVLGTQAVAPTAVNAGLAGLPATGSSSNRLLAQLMVGGGLVLLLAGGWLGFGRREYGAHQA